MVVIQFPVVGCDNNVGSKTFSLRESDSKEQPKDIKTAQSFGEDCIYIKQTTQKNGRVELQRKGGLVPC